MEKVFNRVVIAVSWRRAGEEQRRRTSGPHKVSLMLVLFSSDLQIILFLLLAALLLAVGCGFFSSWVMKTRGPLAPLVVNGDPVYMAFLIFWGYIILLSPAMPIALYITLVFQLFCFFCFPPAHRLCQPRWMDAC